MDSSDVLQYPDIYEDIVIPLYDDVLSCAERVFPCTVFKVFKPIQGTDVDGAEFLYNTVWYHPRIELTPQNKTIVEDFETVFELYSRHMSKYKCQCVNRLLVYNNCIYSFSKRDNKLLVNVNLIWSCNPRPTLSNISCDFFEHSDFDWIDFNMNLEKSISTFHEKCHFNLPKDGDVAHEISVYVNEKCQVSLMIGGSEVWSSNVNEDITIKIPFALNMLQIGDHSVYLQVDSPNATVSVKYRLIRDIQLRKELATSTGSKWYEYELIPPP